jgi:hypothetical protein
MAVNPVNKRKQQMAAVLFYAMQKMYTYLKILSNSGKIHYYIEFRDPTTNGAGVTQRVNEACQTANKPSL